MIAQAHPTQLDTWRRLAHRFHCTGFLVADGRLPGDFEPRHVAGLVKKDAVSRSERNVCRFLLHVWNQKAHRFNLSDTIGWDRDHLAALAAWATGEATGQPGHYF